jgi:hypothetical protein
VTVAEIDDLRARLAAAELVCRLVGTAAADQQTDQGRAVTQAWMEWSHAYRHLVDPVSDEQVLELAARRDVIRNHTLARLRKQDEQNRLDRDRLGFLEFLYEQQERPPRPEPGS